MRTIPSSFSLRFLLVTSIEMRTGVPSSPAAADEPPGFREGSRMPIVEARDLERAVESLVRPSLSRVVANSRWVTDASRRYTIAPSHGELARASSSSRSSETAAKSVMSETSVNLEKMGKLKRGLMGMEE